MKRICVYCGSHRGQGTTYIDAARELGTALGERGIRLVFGGGTVGLMGAVAEASLEAGGRVTGVIPEDLLAREVFDSPVADLRVVTSMHERKALMAELADAFMALPGGLGTLDELYEILTWSQLGYHDKPCGLVNLAGYYDHLLRFLDHSVAEGFLAPIHRDRLLVETTPLAMLDRLAAAAQGSEGPRAHGRTGLA